MLDNTMKQAINYKTYINPRKCFYNNRKENDNILLINN